MAATGLPHPHTEPSVSEGPATFRLPLVHNALWTHEQRQQYGAMQVIEVRGWCAERNKVMNKEQASFLRTQTLANEQHTKQVRAQRLEVETADTEMTDAGAQVAKWTKKLVAAQARKRKAEERIEELENPAKYLHARSQQEEEMLDDRRFFLALYKTRLYTSAKYKKLTKRWTNVQQEWVAERIIKEALHTEKRGDGKFIMRSNYHLLLFYTRLRLNAQDAGHTEVVRQCDEKIKEYRGLMVKEKVKIRRQVRLAEHARSPQLQEELLAHTPLPRELSEIVIDFLAYRGDYHTLK